MIPLNFFKADFHVHTPASHCFFSLEETDERAYIKILQDAKDNNINIIAITDHNTFDGYREILRIKEKYERDLETITRYNLTQKSTGEVKEIISLFSDILILPGVEYDARPGIHLLLLFNPNSDLSELDDFLDRGGVISGMKGDGNKGPGKWDVIDTLDHASTLDSIAFGAHVDRDKGIYHSLSGSYRKEILNNEHLFGLEFKNVLNREKIKNLLRDPAYQRKFDLALIQGSDFHNKINEKIGTPLTYIRLYDKSFVNLKESFQNPIGNISSPESPETDLILRSVEEDDRTYFLEDHKNEEHLIKAVISLANIGSGNILLGEGPEKNRFGLDKDKIESIKNYVKNSITKNVEPQPKMDFRDLPIDKKSILNLGIKSSAFSVYSNKISGEVFIWKEKKPRVAEKGIVTDLLRENIKRETNRFLSQKIKRIEDISHHLNKLRDDLEGMYITYKLEKCSHSLADLFNIFVLQEDSIIEKTKGLKNYKKEIESIIRKSQNGSPQGNTIFLASEFPPRFDDTVLRYSVPKYQSQNNILKYLPDIPIKGQKLILVKGGGVFFSDKEEKILTPDMIYGKLKYHIVLLQLKTEFEDCYSLKYLLAYLKSVPLLWLVYSIYDSVDIYRPNIFNKIPAPPECNNLEKFDNDVGEILRLEEAYLKGEKELEFLLEKSPKDRDRLKKNIQNKMLSHNNLINKHSKSFDNYFFQLFDINEEEKNLLCKMLKAKKIFVDESL